MLARIRELAGQGYGIVLSTHDPDHALLVGTRVAIIAEGGLKAIGKTGDVVSRATSFRFSSAGSKSDPAAPARSRRAAKADNAVRRGSRYARCCNDRRS